MFFKYLASEMLPSQIQSSNRSNSKDTGVNLIFSYIFGLKDLQVTSKE